MKYEYKKTNQLSEAQLNHLGRKGWELVGISQYNLPFGTTLDISYIFKRTIKQTEPTNHD